MLKCLALKGLQIESSIQKLLQRHQVSVPVSRGRCSRWVTAHVPRGGETVRGGLAWPLAQGCMGSDPSRSAIEMKSPRATRQSNWPKAKCGRSESVRCPRPVPAAEGFAP